MSLQLSKCDEACRDCVKKYVSKHKLHKGARFEVPCEGIPKDYLSSVMRAGLESPDFAVSILDPVEWARVNLDWHCLDADGAVWKRKTEDGSVGEFPKWTAELAARGKSPYNRPYQAIMLRCSSRRKVARIGRQAGKCLVSGSSIQMASGVLKAIEDVIDGELVVGVNENYETQFSPAYKQCNGIKEAFRLELADGRSIEGTGNHPFLARTKIGRETTGLRRVMLQDEWKELQSLTSMDYVAVPQTIVTQTGERVNKQILFALGCLLADGNITKSGPRFSSLHPSILMAFAASLQSFGCHLKHYDYSLPQDWHIRCSGKKGTHHLKNWLKQIGIWGLDSHHKYIPEFFMKMDLDSTAYLLKAMFACDGWASVDKNGRGQIGYCTVSETLAQQIVSLLARFGIYADTRHKVIQLNGKTFGSRQITITRKESVILFERYINIFTKEQQVENVLQVARTKQGSPKTEVYTEQNLVFVRVKRIVPLGPRMTWDLTVPKTRNFIANNILTHNTDCICISILHNIFTRPNFTVLVLTPYQAQINLIFERLTGLIKDIPSLQGAIIRSVKAPNYSLELSNGSKVAAFTAGTKSNSEAGASRGQHANQLVYDEADYLASGDIDASLAVTTNFPEATVWMSSTPTGRRERFYKTCFSKLYKEFHFSARANPTYSEDTERLFREQYTELGYIHEVLAEFGEQEEGVFQNRYIEAAQDTSYTYSSIGPRPHWLYSIGVDWNDTKIGTTILVTGYNPGDKLFRVVDKRIISRAGWTQLAACEAVVQLNRYWSPITIYVDKGFGHAQVEILQKYGADAAVDPQRGPLSQDAKLARIVKSYDFGSTVEINDLFTKEPRKKPAKAFLIESTVRRFETQTLRYPIEDEKLTASLRGYVIKRVSQSGTPVYEAQDETAGDHLIDALALSIVGFVLEKTEFGQLTFDSHITFSGQFGEKTIYKPLEPEEKKTQKKESLKPTKRTMEAGTHGTLPAAHTSLASKPKLWSWPGFMKDLPPPTSKKGASLRRNRPQRAKF